MSKASEKEVLCACVDRACALEAEIKRLTLQVVNLRAGINWACGNMPDGNGQWFSDVMPATTEGQRYWWRSHLRKVSGIDVADGEEVERTEKAP